MQSCLKSALLSLSVLSLGLAGCSGSGGPSSGAGAAPAAAKMVTGVAATGAPIAGVVYLLDTSSSPVTLKTTTASDGSFSFNAAGLTAPFLLKTSTGGQNLYSIATDFGITNVTPLTSMALDQAAGGVDLDTLYNNHVQADISAAAAKIPDAVTAVQLALAPLMAQYGVGSMNFLNAQFSANHVGIDAMLDAITVAIANGTVNITNKQGSSVVFTAPCGNLSAGNLVLTGLPTPSSTPPSSTTPPAPGIALYASLCAGCHGDITNSSLKGIATVGAIQAAIAANTGGMNMYSGMSAADMQAISDVLMASSSTSSSSTTTTPDGAALYAANCAGCHGSLVVSSKIGATVVRVQNAISGNVGGMGTLSNLSAADIQAIVGALNPPASTPAPVPSPTPTPDGAALYAANCAGCHGALASSSKQGVTIARLQSAISTVGAMSSLSTLTVTEVQAIVTALNPTTPTPTPTPTSDGATLYSTNCAGCHGVLASSSKAGATLVQIQAGISGNTGGMGSLSSLTSTQLSAVVTALAGVTPSPTATPACGSCHAIPPATGHHSTHRSEGISCAICHGAGYSTTAFNAATHNNGVKDIVSTIGWDVTTRTCSNSCHGKHTW
jgi:mono/diheme cytochrome c family protein